MSKEIALREQKYQFLEKRLIDEQKMSRQHGIELERQLELLKQDGNTKFKETVA